MRVIHVTNCIKYELWCLFVCNKNERDVVFQQEIALYNHQLTLIKETCPNCILDQTLIKIKAHNHIHLTKNILISLNLLFAPSSMLSLGRSANWSLLLFLLNKEVGSWASVYFSHIINFFLLWSTRYSIKLKIWVFKPDVFQQILSTQILMFMFKWTIHASELLY